MSTTMQAGVNPTADGRAKLDLAASTLRQQIARLARELESERSYRRRIEKDMRELRRAYWAYKGIGDVYTSLTRDVESDAQDPFDEHFRECFHGLRAIAGRPEACTCQAPDWRGEGHDGECPIRIATDAAERASNALGEALKARNPQYVGAKGGATISTAMTLDEAKPLPDRGGQRE